MSPGDFVNVVPGVATRTDHLLVGAEVKDCEDHLVVYSYECASGFPIVHRLIGRSKGAVRSQKSEVGGMTSCRIHAPALLPLGLLLSMLVTTGLLTGQPALAQAAGSGSTTALTCFAIDVSESNVVSANGEPPSDPGPIFVRQQVVELYSEVLTNLGQAAGQHIGAVTFGTGIGATLGPVDLSDTAALSELNTALAGALRPSAAEAAWTNWVAGVDGCRRMFQRSGATRGMVVVLSDGYPQAPADGPAEQLRTISPMAQALWSKGIAIQPIPYGAGADKQGPAREAMARLATMGHSQLILAGTPLKMLRAALQLASLATALPLGGLEISVNGSSTVPLELPVGVARAVLVILRSSTRVQLSVAAPHDGTISSLPAKAKGLGLVIPIAQLAAGTYQVSAHGRGAAFVAEMFPHVTGTRARSHQGSASLDTIRRTWTHGWGLAALLCLGLLALSAALAAGRLVARRHRLKGAFPPGLAPLSGVGGHDADPLHLGPGSGDRPPRG